MAIVTGSCARSAQSSLDRGNAFLEKGDVSAAIIEYRAAVERDPLLAQAHQKLAEAYLKQGNGAEALASLVRAADLLPRDVQAQVKAGSLLLLAGRFEDARSRADKALAVDARSVDALVLRANALANLRDLDGALEQIQQAIALEPRSALQTNMGAIEAARGNVPEAEQAYRKAVEIDPKSVAAQVALGQFLWGAGRGDEAEAVFRAAYAVDPKDVQANRWLATFYMRTGRAAEAEPHFRMVAETVNDAGSALALTDYYLALGRRDEARKTLDALSARPEYWPIARARTAELLHDTGEKAEAMRVVDEVIAKHPTLVGGHLVRGRLLLASGRGDEAKAEAQAALKLDPKNAEASFLLGRAEEARRDLDAAAKAYGDVLAVNPRAATAQVRLAMVQMQRNDLGAAAQLAEQAAAAQPRGLEARLVLARTLVARREIERAAAVTDALAREFPNAAVVKNQVGMLALARGDAAGARAAFDQALALQPTMVEPLAALVSLDLQQKQPAQARARVEQRLAQAPNSSAVLALAGRTWASTGDPVKGEEFLRKAIDIDATNLEAYSDLARLLMAQRKLGDAVAAFDALAAKQPRAIGPQTMAAIAVQQQGNEAEARRRYEKILEIDPQAALAANNLAWMLASKGEQLDRALQLAQSAKAALPDEPEINDTLAVVYLKKQLPALAIPPLKVALERVPGNPAFHYHLGQAYAQTGNKDAARQALEQALRLQPDFADADAARQLLATVR
ncbi:tetratricopeptide repeat protein [Luteitalea sp. TBR-22]|uniref:tetratricopeptide repeat protein n=1 Tax=Luteitalea sp. TBR-22 TaxID=2802971 RepID=UPI002103F718|nr:tetratricopeptide repeat protein [Luteitalea sp. TBR-22]